MGILKSQKNNMLLATYSETLHKVYVFIKK